MIPKLIHYCWFGEKMPPAYAKIVENWKRIMPDYEFHLWENKHIKEYDVKFVKQAMSKGHYAFVADYFRLRKIYELGGFYLDTDMLLLTRLDSFLDKEFVICSEVPGRIAWGVFGSIALNPFIKECYEKYHTMQYDQFNPPVIPYLLNSLTSNFISENPVTRLNLEPEHFYPMPMAHSSSDYFDYVTPKTIGIHLWDFSWKKLKQDRSKFEEILYRIITLAQDLLRLSYSPYYFKINIIRIIRLLRS